MQDPQFLSEIEKSRSEISPLPGDKLQKLVAAAAEVSPAIVVRIRQILGISR